MRPKGEKIKWNKGEIKNQIWVMDSIGDNELVMNFTNNCFWDLISRSQILEANKVSKVY